LNKFTQWEDLLPYLLNRPRISEDLSSHFENVEIFTCSLEDQLSWVFWTFENSQIMLKFLDL
jgi:hypothetical protein